MEQRIIRRVYDCDAGIMVDGQKYEFTDHDGIAFTYSRKNHLGRGANGTNKKGYNFREGSKVADFAELTVTDCPVDVYNMINSLFESEGRLDFFFIDRNTGAGTTFKDSVVRDKPTQLAINEDESSMSFMFAVESFNVKEKVIEE